MSARLRRFTPGEVILTGPDAHSVLRFFSITPGISPERLTMEDRAFVQALLVQAIDLSFDSAYVAVLFNPAGSTPLSSVEDIVFVLERFAFRAAMHWFENGSGLDLLAPRIYESVRLLVARKSGRIWRTRLASGQLTY